VQVARGDAGPDAVLYRMLLFGEIASVLPDELGDRYPDVAWWQIRAFRNLAVHKYFGADAAGNPGRPVQINGAGGGA
jgi:uncharacterized protein with HEPN domain